MLKAVLILFGTISLSLGIIGVVVPGLPTTPFILLSATLYFKSSKKLYNWLINHRFFGKIIKNYRAKNAISVKTKWFSLILMWIMILASVFFGISNLHLKIFVLALGLVGSFFMGRIPTYKNE